MNSDIFLKIKLKLLSIMLDSIESRLDRFGEDSRCLRDEICSIKLSQGNEWVLMLGKIQEDFRSSKIPTSKFLKYKSIKGPLHSNQQYLAMKYLKAINTSMSQFSSDRRDLLNELLTDEPFGAPNSSYFCPRSSTQNIQHIYHLLLMQRNLGLDFNTLSRVFEFGGGYGNVARLISMSGFCGTYSIFDFNLMGLIQKYYLSNARATADKFTQFEFVSSLEEFTKDSIDIDDGNSLFIATWSMSESPVAVRESLLNKIKSTKYIYITFQDRWHGNDNLEYFSSLSAKLKSHTSHIIPCTIFTGNYYFVGTRL